MQDKIIDLALIRQRKTVSQKFTHFCDEVCEKLWPKPKPEPKKPMATRNRPRGDEPPPPLAG